MISRPQERTILVFWLLTNLMLCHCCSKDTVEPTAEAGTKDCSVEVVNSSVVINEIMVQPEDVRAGAWIELYNTAKARIDLSGWTIELDSEHRAFLKPNTKIEAESFLLLRQGEDFDFALPMEGGLKLRDACDQETNTLNWNSRRVFQNVTQVRYPDAADFWTLSDKPTPAAPNRLEDYRCSPQKSPIIEPVWIAGGSGAKSEVGKFGKPDAIFLDKQGILFAGDEDENYEEIHLFDTRTDDPEVAADFIEPIIDFSADPGPGGDGPLEFRGVSGFAQDPSSGKIYVVEQKNGRLQILKPTADPDQMPYYEFDSFFGSFAADRDNPEDGEFVRLQAVRTDALGRLFISDDARDNAEQARRDIQVFSADLEYLFKFGDASYGKLGQDGNLKEPENFVIDERRDRIYACDEGPKNIAVFRYSDQQFLQRVEGFIGIPNGLDIDQYGYLYVVDEGNDSESYVRVFEPEKLTEVFRFGGHSPEGDLTPGLFNSTDTLIIDIEQDLLIVADQGHSRVQGFSLSSIQQAACLRSLQISGPTRTLAGHAFSLRVDLLGPLERRDRESFEVAGKVTAKTISGNPVPIVPSTFKLNNGSGSVSLVVQNAGKLVLTLFVGGVNGEHTVEVSADLPTRPLKGTLASKDLVWNQEDGVVVIDDAITVPAGSTLDIERGTLVMLGDEARIEILGSVVAHGTWNRPIQFFADNTEIGWGQIDHHPGYEKAEYIFTYFANGGNAYWERNDEFRHCCAYNLRMREGCLYFIDSMITDSPGKGLLSFGAQVLLRGSLFNRLGMGAELAEGSADIQDTYFTDLRGVDDTDGLYLSAVDAPGRFQLQRVVFADGDDDGIDTENSSPIVRDLVAYGFADKAIALTGGSPRFENCLVFDSEIAVRIDDKFRTAIDRPEFIHCTFVENNSIGFYASDREGLDADADIRPVLTASVIWDNPVSIATDFTTTLITVEQSVVENPPAGISGTRIVPEEPIFLEPVRRIYRLHPLSPGYAMEGAVVPSGWQGF